MHDLIRKAEFFDKTHPADLLKSPTVLEGFKGWLQRLPEEKRHLVHNLTRGSKGKDNNVVITKSAAQRKPNGVAKSYKVSKTTINRKFPRLSNTRLRYYHDAINKLLDPCEQPAQSYITDKPNILTSTEANALSRLKRIRQRRNRSSNEVHREVLRMRIHCILTWDSWEVFKTSVKRKTNQDTGRGDTAIQAATREYGIALGEIPDKKKVIRDLLDDVNLGESLFAFVKILGPPALVMMGDDANSL